MGSFEVGDPVLEQISYWRVVTESVDRNKCRCLTNVFSAILSESQAKVIALENAKQELTGKVIEVRRIEFIHGPFWRVYVWRLPAAPDGYSVMDISTKDGAIVNRF